MKVIGCGDAFASGGRLHACFYLKTPECRVLIDCGASTMTGLKKYNVDTNDIDVVLISHFHGDHYGGVPFLLMESATRKRQKPLTIVTPAGGHDRIRTLMELLYPQSGSWEKLKLHFETYPPDGGVLQLGSLGIMAFPVVHSRAASPFGLRLITDGKILGYSGDTAWTPVLIDIARDADLFICECNFYDQEADGHLDYRTFSRQDHRLAYKQVLLTHLGEEMLAMLENVVHPCAREGLEITL